MNRPDKTSGSLRFHLRAATRAEHEALDASFADLLPVPQPAAYGHFLRMNHAAHRGVEAWLATTPLADWLPDWPGWSRLADLEADMAAMDLRPVDAGPFAPDGAALPEAVGVAYVLEGSRLGAVFIHRALQKARAMERLPGAGFAYLENSGEDSRFATLVARMEALSFDETERGRCTDAARAAFGYFMQIRDGAAASDDRITVPA